MLRHPAAAAALCSCLAPRPIKISASGLKGCNHPKWDENRAHQQPQRIALRPLMDSNAQRHVGGEVHGANQLQAALRARVVAQLQPALQVAPLKAAQAGAGWDSRTTGQTAWSGISGNTLSLNRRRGLAPGILFFRGTGMSTAQQRDCLGGGRFNVGPSCCLGPFTPSPAAAAAAQARRVQRGHPLWNLKP